jgi:branched-chain amino acid transport system substrate-binding protein
MKAIAAAIERAGSTDSEKLVAAFEGLTFSTPMGPLAFRSADHQSTMGSWIGKTALRDGNGVMVDWVYADGAKYLPPADEAGKLRPAQ